MSSDKWDIVKDADSIRIMDENGLTVATLGPLCDDDAREIIAGKEALHACRLLVEAYNKGIGIEHVDWDDVGMAHLAAIEAMSANGEDPEHYGLIQCHACKAWTSPGNANCTECDANLMGSEQVVDEDDE